MVRISGERCLEGRSECEETGVRDQNRKRNMERERQWKERRRREKKGLRICLLKLDEEVEAAGVH